MKKTSKVVASRRSFRLFVNEFSLLLAAIVLLAASCYAFVSAANLKDVLYDAAARAAAAAAGSVLRVTADAYNDDLRSLHLEVESQGTAFDDLCGLLARTAHAAEIDSLVTVARRTQGDAASYVYILDSRFSRKLTPNVEYHTVGSACSLREEGGAALERILPRVEKGELPYGYTVVAPKGSAAYLVCAFPLFDGDNTTIGTVLAHLSGGLFAQVNALALPHYILAALLLLAALITAALLWAKHSARKRLILLEQPREDEKGDSHTGTLAKNEEQP